MKISEGHKGDTIITSFNLSYHIMTMVGLLVDVILTIPVVAKLTLNAELNPLCHLLALLAYHILHVSKIEANSHRPYHTHAVPCSVSSHMPCCASAIL
jgi:hypothetical protein